jgi:hypothetical protein
MAPPTTREPPRAPPAPPSPPAPRAYQSSHHHPHRQPPRHRCHFRYCRRGARSVTAGAESVTPLRHLLLRQGRALVRPGLSARCPTTTTTKAPCQQHRRPSPCQQHRHATTPSPPPKSTTTDTTMPPITREPPCAPPAPPSPPAPRAHHSSHRHPRLCLPRQRRHFCRRRRGAQSVTAGRRASRPAPPPTFCARAASSSACGLSARCPTTHPQSAHAPTQAHSHIDHTLQPDSLKWTSTKTSTLKP